MAQTTTLALFVVAVAALCGCASAVAHIPAATLMPAHAVDSAPVGPQGVPYCPDGAIYNATLDKMLGMSTAMPTQIVEISAAIPLGALWGYIKQARFVDWNPLFNTVATPLSDIALCSPLNAVYNNGQFLAPILPKSLSGPHHVIQMGCNKDNSSCAFGWFFHLYELPANNLITYGRHTFTFIDNGDGTTIIKSWEKAAGTNVQQNSLPWTIALQESLHDAVLGILCMERVYQTTGALAASDVANACVHFIV